MYYQFILTIILRQIGRYISTYFYFISSELSLMVAIIFFKLSNPVSMFSIISLAKISGSGRLSRPAKLLSLSQKISRFVLSLA